jgi:hypothetical protein
MRKIFTLSLTLLLFIVAFVTKAQDSLKAGRVTGVIYNKFYWSSLSEFTYSGFTPTISANNINFSGGTGTSTKTMILNGYTNQDELLDINAVYTINTLGTGLGVGRKSINTVGIGYSSYVYYDATANQLFIKGLSNSTVNTIASKVSPITVAAGDNCSIKYSQRAFTLTATFTDITQGLSFSISSTTNLITGIATFSIPNAADIALYNIGGNMDINAIDVFSNTPYNPDLIYVGDSKLDGVSSGGMSLRAANLIKTLGISAVFCGKADATAQMKAAAAYIINYIKPKVILFNDGRNDIAYATDTTTWHNDYRTMVSSWTAAGIRVVHLLPIPETVIPDQSSITNFINANYSAFNIIDPSTGFNISTDLEPSGIHPNTHGNKIIANNFIASGKIPIAINSAINIPVSDYYTTASSSATTALGVPFVAGFAGTTITASTTNYTWINSSGLSFSTSEGGRIIIMPNGGTLKNLYVKTIGTQPITGTLIITIRKNSADQTLTITIPAGATSGVFTDLTHSVSLVAGDTLSIGLVNSATGSSTGLVAVSTTFTPL